MTWQAQQRPARRFPVSSPTVVFSDGGPLAAMVLVRVDLWVMVEGIVWSGFDGIGYVLDASRGYVPVCRAAVTSGLAKVVVTIVAAQDVPVTVRFVHPVLNLPSLSTARTCGQKS
ncbi:hypothetical protein H257_15906 [Aphanomyces astaci]|uniref:Uncharacterized protein n=1 Tax=Aphanomyces astaci TaxID=112090 RepID=W4FK83_APHAT|nr:hypothetical protein H257_15906 [Aphanomyces astaci]ETV67917.1 hypothetical protein H257_15906 [Aphanomyces astaci]|eukprot:XP_009842480.1 hypothetical protein H257_15906 [Aphanomyces astaci]